MKRYLSIIAVLALLVPSVLLAQDALTLEGLAKQVTDLAERIAIIEEIWMGPGPIVLEDGDCTIGLNKSLQDETVIKFKDTYDEWLTVDGVRISQIMYLPESGNIAVVYEEYWDRPSTYVIESWNGCEFLGSSDWWEED
ncbi:MAG: hypothetical protein OXJ55_10785 [Caldilineaceae bacterium]|nr:hypothetical protein [Caldilineaceae bacterium]MDE0463099.1 hypothetical protein [Caldilineaceae bacterium]